MNQNNIPTIEILSPEEITLRGLVNQQKQRIASLALQTMTLTRYLQHIQNNFNLTPIERSTLARFHDEFKENFL